MGQLAYGDTDSVFEVEDRALAHIEMVVLAKLRRHESFALSLGGPGAGRATIWLNPASTLRFTYASEAEPLNRAWLEVLVDAANSTSGLRLLPEPPAPASA